MSSLSQNQQFESDHYISCRVKEEDLEDPSVVATVEVVVEVEVEREIGQEADQGVRREDREIDHVAGQEVETGEWLDQEIDHEAGQEVKTGEWLEQEIGHEAGPEVDLEVGREPEESGDNKRYKKFIAIICYTRVIQ